MGTSRKEPDPTLPPRLLDRLPAAVFVIDGVGTISFATSRAATMVGRTPEDLVGESVLAFVSADTAWAYSAAVALATDYSDMVMGPLRVTFVGDGDGPRTADLWATNHLDDPEIGGIICMLTEETTAMGLGEAVAAIANREPLATIAARVVVALRGHPVVAQAVVYDVIDNVFRPVTPTAVPSDLVSEYGDDLWRPAAETGVRQQFTDLAELPASMRAAAEREGYSALWIEPIVRPGSYDQAVLVLWRPHAGGPSPNELSSVHQAASILSIAFDVSAR